MYRRAFSLVELVMVLAIVATLSAIAVPRYAQSIQRYRVEAAAQRIAADLLLARSRASATSSTQTVSFSLSSNQYQILEAGDLDHPTSTYTVAINERPYEARLVSVDLDGAQQISFDGFGVPDRAGRIVVAAGNQQRTVTIDAGTGKAVVQ